MSDESYPIIEPDGEELSFQNAWRSDLPQTLGSTECFDFSAQPNEAENLIIMKLTGQELTDMLSALYIGAEFAYPEKYLEIIRPLLSATSCPPLMEEQQCYEYPSYSSFVRYSPMSPFVNPNEIPDGYATQPFLANGVNGNDIPNYQLNDVIVPTDAITFEANWFDDLAGVLPTIEIVVNGQGTVFIKFLTVPLGGLVVVTVDNPPNIADIITGIVGGAENIIDLNQDMISLPPETAKEIVFEVETIGTGIHTIYAVFLPILDDSLIPIRFGGGFRGIQLCDFIASGDMGIQNLRFSGCDLQQQNQDGTWQTVTGWENWLDCVPSGGGGGGGGAALRVFTEQFDPAANVTNNTTSYTNALSIAYTPQHSKMLVIWDNITLSNSAAAGIAEIRTQFNGLNGQDSTIIQANGTGSREISVGDWFSGLAPGVSHTLALQLRSATASNTATIGAGADPFLTVIEFDDLSEMFVQDIRIQGNEIQKKIGGVWLTVTDSLAAILAAIQATANNAINLANSAISVNSAQQAQINSIISVNNTQNSRLSALESWKADVDLSLSQIALTLDNHEDRIAALEAMSGGASSWGGYPLGAITHSNMSPSLGYYSPFSSVGSGGWSPTANNDIQLYVTNGNRLGACVFVRVTVLRLAGFAGVVKARVNEGEWANLIPTSYSGDNIFAWFKVRASENADMRIDFQGSLGNTNWRANSAVYLCVNYNPFTLELF